MGCCVSAPRTQKPESFESKSPPPSVLEDQETIVKEVLSVSENPILLQQQEQQKRREPFVDEIKINVRENKSGFQEKREQERETETETEQEVSEVCSLSAFSESLSTTPTTTNTNALINNSFKRENGNIDSDNEESYGTSFHRQEVKQRVNRSQSPVSRTGSRNRVPSKSPSRRTDYSPVKRGRGGAGVGGGGGSLRLVQSGRDNQMEFGNVGQSGRVGVRGSGLRSELNRRDPGEDSSRRSRSPATNRSALGRSPSARRTNRSPGRIRSSQNENVGSDTTSNKWENSNTTKESLENPLVSLECFIFL